MTHAARGMNSVSNVEEFVDPSLLPNGPVRIAAFDGENADPANGRAMGGGVLAHTGSYGRQIGSRLLATPRAPRPPRYSSRAIRCIRKC